MGVSALFAIIASNIFFKWDLSFIINYLKIALILLNYTLLALIYYGGAILTAVSSVIRDISRARRSYFGRLLIPNIWIRVFSLNNINLTGYPQPNEYASTYHKNHEEKETADGLSQYLDFAMELFSLLVLTTFILRLCFSLLP